MSGYIPIDSGKQRPLCIFPNVMRWVSLFANLFESRGFWFFVCQSWMGRDIFLVHCHGHFDMRNHTLKGAAGCACQGHDHGSKRKSTAVYEGQWPWSNHRITTIHPRLASSGTCLFLRFPKSSIKQCLPWSRVCALLYIEVALATNR